MSSTSRSPIPSRREDLFGEGSEAIQTCDDLTTTDDGAIAIKVSARQFERVVNALRAGAVPHNIHTTVQAMIEDPPRSGKLRQRTTAELKASAYTVLSPAAPPARRPPRKPTTNDDEPF